MTAAAAVNSECDEAPTRPASDEQPSARTPQSEQNHPTSPFLFNSTLAFWLSAAAVAHTHTPTPGYRSRRDKSQRHKKTLILCLSFHWGRISSRDLAMRSPRSLFFTLLAADKRRKVNLDNLLPTSQNSQRRSLAGFSTKIYGVKILSCRQQKNILLWDTSS